MRNKAWEIKCPESSKMDKIRQNIPGSYKQSRNIIIGTFKTPVPDEKILRYIDKYLEKHKDIKGMIVITKTLAALDLK